MGVRRIEPSRPGGAVQTSITQLFGAPAGAGILQPGQRLTELGLYLLEQIAGEVEQLVVADRLSVCLQDIVVLAADLAGVASGDWLLHHRGDGDTERLDQLGLCLTRAAGHVIYWIGTQEIQDVRVFLLEQAQVANLASEWAAVGGVAWRGRRGNLALLLPSLRDERALDLLLNGLVGAL